MLYQLPLSKRMKIGTNIRKIREQKELAQEYVASQLNISQPSYSKIENERTQVTVNTLDKIASILGVSICDIICFNDEAALGGGNSSWK